MDLYNVPASCLSILVYCLWISTSKGVPVLTSFPDPPIEGKPFTFACTEIGGLDPNQVVWYRNNTDKNVRLTTTTIIFGNVVKDLNVTVNSNQFKLTFFFLISQEKNIPWRCSHRGVSSNTITITDTQNEPTATSASTTTDLSPIYTLVGIGAAVILVTIFIVIFAARRNSRKDHRQWSRRSSTSSSFEGGNRGSSVDMVHHDMYRSYLGHRAIPTARGWNNNFVDMVDNDMYRSNVSHKATPTPRVWQDNFLDVYSQVIKPRYNDYQHSVGRMGRF